MKFMKKYTLILMLLAPLMILLASCDLTYNDKGNITASAKTEDSQYTSLSESKAVLPGVYTSPAYYKLEVRNKDNIIVDSQYVAYEGTTVSFNNIPLGTYKLIALGYKSESDRTILGYGEAEVTVKAGETNSAVVLVSPVSDSTIAQGTKGTVNIKLAWQNDVAVTRVDLVKSINDTVEVVASQENKDTTAREIQFNQSLEVGLGQSLYFIFYNGNDYLGETEPVNFDIYAGQEAIPEEEDKIKYEQISFDQTETLSGFGILDISTTKRLNELTFFFEVPESFKAINISYKIGTTTTAYKTITPDDPALEGLNAKDIAYYTITDLPDGTECTIYAELVKTEGVASKSIYRTMKTATPLKMVTVSPLHSEDEEKMSIGRTMEMKLESYPADASDFGGTWASTNPGVATVDQNGVVTGKNMGTANITYTAVNGTKIGSYNLKISLFNPILTLEKQSDSFKLTWNNVVVATEYKLYRTDGKTEELLETISGDEITEIMTYEDTTAVSGVYYSYYVTASYTDNEGTLHNASSEVITDVYINSPSISIVCPEGPEDLSVVMEGVDNNIILSWDDELTLTADVKGISNYEWILNGVSIGTGNTVTINQYTDGINASHEVSIQAIMLKAIDSSGFAWSGTKYFFYADATEENLQKATQLSLMENPSLNFMEIN